MYHVFIEMYAYTGRWRALPRRQREDVVAGMLTQLAGLSRSGVEVLACAANDPDTPTAPRTTSSACTGLKTRLRSPHCGRH